MPSSSALPPTPSPAVKLARWTLGFSLLAIAGFSLLDLSATLAFRTPWWLPLTMVQMLPLAVLMLLAMSGALAQRTTLTVPGQTRANVSFGAVTIGVAVLWIGALASALVSPHRNTALVNTTSILSALSIGVSCAILLSPQAKGFTGRLSRLRNIIGWVFVALLIDSLGRWLVQDLLPGLAHGAEITKALGDDAWQFSWEGFRNLRPFGHANYTAGLAVLMIPWLAFLAWDNRGKARAGWLISTLFAGVLLFSSGSRGGLLGLAAASGIGAVMALWVGGRRLRLLAIFALLAGGLLIVANPRMRETLTGVSRSEQMPSSSDLERGSMLKAGLHMGVDRWLTGWGAGTTPLVFPAYRGQLGVSLENSFQLHNQIVTAWAEGGLLAIVGFGLVLAGLGRQTRAILLSRLPPSKSVRLTGIASILSLSGYVIMLSTDTQLDVAFFGAATAVLVAVLCACGRSCTLTGETVDTNDVTTKRIPMGARIAIGGAVLASLGLVVAATVPQARVRSQLANAFLDFDAQRQDLFVESLRETAREFPDDFVVANLRAWADPRIAREQWERSLAINPLQELPHTNLGWLLWKTEPAIALAHFKAAAALVPDKRGAFFGQALAHLALRDPSDLAISALTQECLRNPDFVLSPLWKQEPFVRIWPSLSVRLRAELGKLAVAPELPAWVRAEATDFLLLLDWQEGTGGDVKAIQSSFKSASRRAYFNAFDNPEKPLAKEAGPAAWQLLARSPNSARTAYARLTGVILPTTVPLVAILQERAAQGWPLKATVAARGAVTEPIGKVRYNRPGYAILVRNTDLPMMEDLHETERQDSVVFTEVLFPRKGWCLPLPIERRTSSPNSSPRS